MYQCVGRLGRDVEAFVIRLGGVTPGADLGGSSKYSSRIFEDRSGEGFHANCGWT